MQLLYWGKATVIYPLCNTNLYVVSPNVPDHLSPVLVEKFAEQFPGMSLADYIQMFSLPNSLTQALPTVSRKDEYQLLAKIIVWCLQHHLLIQLHTYVSLALTDDCDTVLPDPLEKNSTYDEDNGLNMNDRKIAESGNASNKDESRLGDWPPFQTVRESGSLKRRNRRRFGTGKTEEELLSVFNEAEKAAILAVPAASKFEDLRLFVRLAPYFNGKYHLEEIMYHENVRRSHLLQLIDKFRDVVIRHEHEDTNVTLYFNTSIKSWRSYNPFLLFNYMMILKMG